MRFYWLSKLSRTEYGEHIKIWYFFIWEEAETQLYQGKLENTDNHGISKKSRKSKFSHFSNRLICTMKLGNIHPSYFKSGYALQLDRYIWYKKPMFQRISAILSSRYFHLIMCMHQQSRILSCCWKFFKHGFQALQSTSNIRKIGHQELQTLKS